MTLPQWLEQQILNAAVTGALLALVLFLSRTAISERLKRAIGHEYDEKLEELRATNGRVLEELRAAKAEREAFRAMAMSLLTSTSSSTLERRVAAIEMLWKAFQDLRSGRPYYIGVLDTIGFDMSKLGPKVIAHMQRADFLSDLEPALKLTAEVAKLRPFLGDRLYSLYHAAQAIHGRAVSITISSYQQGKFRHWAEEEGTVELLAAVLTSEEFDSFKKFKSGKLDWVGRQLEVKLIAEIQRELSGEPAAEQALVQASRILEKVSLLER